MKDWLEHFERLLSKAEYVGKRMSRLSRDVEGVNNDQIFAAFSGAVNVKGLPIGRAYLQANFDRSGAGKKSEPAEYKSTGNLAKGVRAVTAKFSLRGKFGPHVYFVMPRKMPDYVYRSKRGKQIASKFYTVAGALQYGAVRQPLKMRETRDVPTGKLVKMGYKPLMGQAQTATVKRVALGGRGLSSREERRLERDVGGLRIMRPRNKSVDITLGNGKTITVIRPMDFFDLTAQQKQQVMQAIAAQYDRNLKDLFNVTGEKGG